MEKVLNALRIALMEKGLHIEKCTTGFLTHKKNSNVPYIVAPFLENNSIYKINVFSYDIDTFVTIDEAIKILTH